MQDVPLSLLDDCHKTLADNSRGLYTIPAKGLYPHQWLWDSCFIAIGLRWLDVDRAKAELRQLLRGQWDNGMLPHMILSNESAYKRDRELWKSVLNPSAPRVVSTSGLTQPPMFAEAIVRIGELLSHTERRSWYKEMYPHLLKYHQWIYDERDPHHEGLAVLIHPYECGLDNTPPWISELRSEGMPLWIKTIEFLHLVPIIELFRRDTRHVPPGQRMSTIEALAYFSALRRLRRKAYNIEAILRRPVFCVQDLAFNAILARANQHLLNIAGYICTEVPGELQTSFKKTRQALEGLWDEGTGYYYSKNGISSRYIKEPNIAHLLLLYAGTISHTRAQKLVEQLKDKTTFGLQHPIPSVPKNSNYFQPEKYWQGPAWINTNWLVHDGLIRYGFEDEAETIRNNSINLVEKHGCYEYFDPTDSSPAGAEGFSWTAALTVDFVYNDPKRKPKD